MIGDVRRGRQRNDKDFPWAEWFGGREKAKQIYVLGNIFIIVLLSLALPNDKACSELISCVRVCVSALQKEKAIGI